MRHIGSLALALLVAPVAWVLTGIGLVGYGRAQAGPDSGADPEVLLGLLALLGAGALLAVLLIPRLSPVGPVVTGLLLLGMTAWATIDAGSLARTLPHEVLGVDLGLSLPAGGVAAVLAVPLLATALSPQRWRRPDRVPVAATTGPGIPPQPGPARYGPQAHPTSGGPAGSAMGAPATAVYIPPSPTSGPPGGFPTAPGAPAGFPAPAGPAAPAGAPAGRAAPAGTPVAGSAHGAPAGVPPLRPAGREPDTDATTRLSVPVPPSAFPVANPHPHPHPAAPARAGSDDEPTTATPTVDIGRPAPTDDEPTVTVDEPTEQIDEVTTRLRGVPPPPAAYPPPGHSTPTAAPVDPDATGRL